MGINSAYGFGGITSSSSANGRAAGGRYSPWSTLDNFHGNYNDNFAVNGINPFNSMYGLRCNGQHMIFLIVFLPNSCSWKQFE